MHIMQLQRKEPDAEKKHNLASSLEEVYENARKPLLDRAAAVVVPL